MESAAARRVSGVGAPSAAFREHIARAVVRLTWRTGTLRLPVCSDGIPSPLSPLYTLPRLLMKMTPLSFFFNRAAVEQCEGR